MSHVLQTLLHGGCADGTDNEMSAQTIKILEACMGTFPLLIKLIKGLSDCRICLRYTFLLVKDKRKGGSN